MLIWKSNFQDLKEIRKWNECLYSDVMKSEDEKKNQSIHFVLLLEVLLLITFES